MHNLWTLSLTFKIKVSAFICAAWLSSCCAHGACVLLSKQYYTLCKDAPKGGSIAWLARGASKWFCGCAASNRRRYTCLIRYTQTLFDKRSYQPINAKISFMWHLTKNCWVHNVVELCMSSICTWLDMIYHNCCVWRHWKVAWPSCSVFHRRNCKLCST